MVMPPILVSSLATSPTSAKIARTAAAAMCGTLPRAAVRALSSRTTPTGGQQQQEQAASEGLRQFFAWLEGRFGGLPMDNAVVHQADELRADDLERLFRHEILALHVPQFFPRREAQALGRQLAQQVTTPQGMARNWKVATRRGLESSDVTTLGAHPPFNVAAAMAASQPKHSHSRQTSNTVEEYFAAVPQEMRNRRFTPQPTLWPLDLLRLELDQVWPAGAGLARDKASGRAFSGGLPRVMEGPTRWKRGYIHVDEMAPLHPRQGLFSANIYLQLPASRGSSSNSNNSEDGDEANKDDESVQEILHIWPVNVRSRWDWYRNGLLLAGLSSQDPEDQARLRDRLGPPATVRAAPGDLVLLCVQRPHAALGFDQGTRVSLQCFLQYQGPTSRLAIDA